MAGIWTTIKILDGDGNPKLMRVWDPSGVGTGPYSFGQMYVDSAGNEVLGTEVDAANIATDTTAISGISIWKQISKSIQALVTANHSDLTAATPAGENHIGQIGGTIGKFQVQFGPATSTAYAIGQVLLGTTEMTALARVDNGTGVMFGSTLVLNVLNSSSVDLFVFSSVPSGTYTAGATFTLNSADFVKLSKIIHIDDWSAAGTAISMGQPLVPAPRLYKCDDTSSKRSLWVVAVARGPITLAAATDGTLTTRVSQN